jgi:hypothetical protein
MNKTWNLRDDPANYDDEGNYVEQPDDGTMDTHPADWERDEEEEKQ